MRVCCAYLVVSSLQERGVDSAHGYDAFTRQTRSKRDGMLLSNPYVETPLGEAFCKLASTKKVRRVRIERDKFMRMKILSLFS